MVVEVVTWPAIAREYPLRRVGFPVIGYLATWYVAAQHNAVSIHALLRVVLINRLIEQGCVFHINVEIGVTTYVSISVPIHIVVIVLVKSVREGHVRLIPIRRKRPVQVTSLICVSYYFVGEYFCIDGIRGQLEGISTISHNSYDCAERGTKLIRHDFSRNDIIPVHLEIPLVAGW